MPAVELNDRYPKMDEYWELVKKTLSHVFQADSDLADILRGELSGRPAEEQLLFYHAEPLDVAADLADQRPDHGQVKAYRQLADQVGWGTP
jgi:hypothetical protein